MVDDLMEKFNEKLQKYMPSTDNSIQISFNLEKFKLEIREQLKQQKAQAENQANEVKEQV